MLTNVALWYTKHAAKLAGDEEYVIDFHLLFLNTGLGTIRSAKITVRFAI